MESKLNLGLLKKLKELNELFRKANCLDLYPWVKGEIRGFDLKPGAVSDPKKHLMKVLLSKCSWMNHPRPKTGVLVKRDVVPIIEKWLSGVIYSTKCRLRNYASVYEGTYTNDTLEEKILMGEIQRWIYSISVDAKLPEKDRHTTLMRWYVLTHTVLGMADKFSLTEGYEKYIRKKSDTGFKQRMTKSLQLLKDSNWYELVLYLRGENKKESHAARLKALDQRS
jgi:hypothetical protein